MLVESLLRRGTYRCVRKAIAKAAAKMACKRIDYGEQLGVANAVETVPDKPL